MTATLRDVLATKGTRVFCLEPYESVWTAVVVMNREQIGSIVIGRERMTLGLLTERDILVRAVEPGLDLRRTQVADVMTKRPLCATPDATILQSMERMTVKRQRHLPVFEGTMLVGIVSLGDLVHHVSRELENRVFDLTRFIHGSHSLPDVPHVPWEERRVGLKARAM